MAEFKEANKAMLRMAEKILDQNSKILEMNEALIHVLGTPISINVEERKEKTDAKPKSVCR